MLVPFTNFVLHSKQLDENLAAIILGSFLYWLIRYYRCPIWHRKFQVLTVEYGVPGRKGKGMVIAIQQSLRGNRSSFQIEPGSHWCESSSSYPDSFTKWYMTGRIKWSGLFCPMLPPL